METIFNHNVTTDEIKIINLLNFERGVGAKMDYEKSIDDNSRYTDLCVLTRRSTNCHKIFL